MTTDTDDRTTLQDFIAAHGVSMTARQVDHNPTPADDDWARTADHWRCTLTCGGRRMVLTFSKGAGHNGKPAELREVLDCVASDAAGVENARDFADWCGDCGYSEDSRKAERIYRICQRQAASLLRLLGREAFDALLWRVERE